MAAALAAGIGCPAVIRRWIEAQAKHEVHSCTPLLHARWQPPPGNLMAKNRSHRSRPPAKVQPTAKKPAAKRNRDPLGPTKHELRCAAKSQTKNCYLGGSKALCEPSAQQRRARTLRAKKASAAARRP